MTCKDCIHYCWCKDTIADENWNEDAPKEIKELFSPVGCENFKNKADFVEVVRCRDCKSSSEPKTVSRLGLYCNNYDVRFCEKEQKIVSANHFCSYGERSDT